MELVEANGAARPGAVPALAQDHLVGEAPLGQIDDEVLPDGAHAVKRRYEHIEMETIGHVTSTYFSPTLGRSIAMGLIKEGDDYVVLTDIQGDEDHLGDMDFKVAGTENGITSLQMDIKVAGITPEIMEKALAQAKAGRMHILGEMSKALSEAGDFSVHAPRIETMTIPTDKIREVIGSGGKVIREIVETSGAKVDINDDGVIKIASPNAEAIQKAYDMIHSIVAEPEEGKIYKGKVVKLVDFGAFVNFFGKRDGLVHVSQIENRRLNHPSDVLKEGQEVWVKLLGFDDRGKVRLSMKVVDQETGEEATITLLQNITILATPTGLLLVFSLSLGWSADGLPVGDLGCMGIKLYTISFLDPCQNDVKMKIPHT